MRAERSRPGRRSLKGVPHVIYTLSDPRTGEVRYVGRHDKARPRRRREHITLAAGGSAHPVHRWVRRLAARGLEPVITIVEDGVESTHETLLCNRLVKEGARLLNTRPGAARLKGPIVVDVEREGDELVADVAHLGMEVREAIIAGEGKYAVGRAGNRLRRRVAVAVLREIADLLETQPTDAREERRKDPRELAVFLENRLFTYCDADIIVEHRAHVEELRALVAEVKAAGNRHVTEEQGERLRGLLFVRVYPWEVEGADHLVRLTSNPHYRNPGPGEDE